MSEENQSNKKDSEVLLEKVREIEDKKKNAGQNPDQKNTALLLGEKPRLTSVLSDEEARTQMRRRSRRGFLVGGAAAVMGYFGYSLLRQPDNEWVFRRTFEFNEKVSGFYPRNLAPEFPRERAVEPRFNGGEGMSDGFDPAAWRLQVVGVANPQNFPQYTNNIAYKAATNNRNANDESTAQLEGKDAKQNPNAPREHESDKASTPETPMSGLLLTLDDIKALPRVEMTTELKCIEGWSAVVNWTGIRFSDFAAKFAPPESTPYVSLVTPDGGYYVGMDMASMMHPQTLLAYEMNGAPLTLPHGAPLRLATTTKYGIKQIKRIGRIMFTNERPADFWAERGYDWYSGH
ncbi:MAG TPA: molybdopterin-dependent oxidoreductase [Pyrinomonadaceae bacterium]|nr:molybdopterin-dependent oxidoreductase [Pyrinomonadaceae bacterium]